ncbi:hypothetical protein CVH10_13720 [Halomonas sp. ND22Bw]|uniref:hypothetical protein n=1 Tax=Halomonas TaxID=2745 RepID=UPI00068D2521|nr:hypothetical protein [Halomonas salina]PSJ21177.1 hypothetical protein CVH10_13720 [Halomonas sp. ND22Bw]
MWRPLGIILFAGLAGCQVAPTQLPVAEPPPAEACHWPRGDDVPAITLAGAVAALEDDDFLIRHTETTLGLVSAERSRRTFFHGAPEPDLFLLGVSRGAGHGVLIGGGASFGLLDDEATEIERVSVAVGERTVRVSRDIRLFDWRGELRRSRTASDDAFCRELREAMRRRSGEAS